jgi:hypothetical protein
MSTGCSVPGVEVLGAGVGAVVKTIGAGATWPDLKRQYCVTSLCRRGSSLVPQSVVWCFGDLATPGDFATGDVDGIGDGTDIKGTMAAV